MAANTQNRYRQIIEDIFLTRYSKGKSRIPFRREDIEQVADKLGVKLPKNLGDLIYTFRFRSDLPDAITSRCPKGKQWVIRLAGKAKYCFVATELTTVDPTAGLAVTKIPDATPGVIVRYALNDEQTLLARLRYNRLIDIFTGIMCYSLQNHLRTTAPDIGQIETDEVYIGLDRRGAHYVFPVQAKSGRDKQSVVQVEQDIAMCKAKFPALICRPIAAQFMRDETIALFEFEEQGSRVVIAAERHYRLVPQENLTAEELAAYHCRSAD